MPECTPEQFAKATRAVVVAPAGCGKTTLIVRSLTTDPSKRDLVLTHTHAGVRALTERCRAHGVRRSRAPVDTIAGWCLRIAASYPKLSGIPTVEPAAGEWGQVYAAASRVLQTAIGRTLVRNSYTGLYVDEYQDCTKQQHEVVRTLAELLPCRVVGDPLQSIFDFGGEKPVEWKTDVNGFFEPLPDLSVPHRWNGAPGLRDWTLYLRQQLLNGKPVDLPAEIVQIVDPAPSSLAGFLKHRRITLPPGETLALITDHPAQAHSLARQHSGYQSLEPVDCPDLFTWTENIDESTPREKALHILAIAGKCFTGMTELKSLAADVRSGTAFKAGKGKWSAVRRAISDLATSGDHVHLLAALESLSDTKRHQGRLYRTEAWTELAKAARSVTSATSESLRAVAWDRRQRLRSTGRKPPRYCIGRPLLVKGLDFTETIVMNPDQFKREEMYVALTRSTHRLLVVAPSSQIQPKA